MKGIRDVLALVKIGIVGSNTLSAAAGFALAAAGSGARAPWGAACLALGGTALLVGGSCAVNNWIDRDLDARMERTRDRPTARGAIGARGALGIGTGLCAAGLALLLAAGRTAAILGLAGALVYVFAYTAWSKRRWASSSLIGGIAGAVPPLIGWAAVDPRLGGAAWALFAFLAIWQQAHVRALALKRAGEYEAANIPMAGLSLDRRASRLAVLAWAAAAIPFTTLAIALAGLPFSGPALVCAALSWTTGAIWISTGIIGIRSPSWPARMFAASLAYLVLVLLGLLAAGA